MMKVTNVRYYTTRRGVGYEATTDTDNTIWNDGSGGDTYLTNKDGGYYHQFNGLMGMELESYLESLIDKYEGVTR
jgi:hypothetical protein